MVQGRQHNPNDFAYDLYMQGEGIPIVREEVGVTDVTQLPREDWARTGGKGTFIELVGVFQCERGIYIGEIPGGGELKPERHLYEKAIFILQGRGSAAVWEGTGKRLTFEWQAGSVFAIPRHCWHQLFNGSREPVIFMAVTTAPGIINYVDDLTFVFNSDYQFGELYTEGDDYFHAPDVRVVEDWYQRTALTTNFIPNAHTAAVDPFHQKVAGGDLTAYRMGKHFPHGHISQWPAGYYHKAHYHGPGAILLGLDGEGYVLAWPMSAGVEPYQDGHADQVVRVEWGQNSIYSPPDAHLHQHFNTGPTPARHIAVHAANNLPLGVHGLYEEQGWGGHKSVKEGGTLIEYEDEDPQILADYERELTGKGIESKMAGVLAAAR